MKPRGYLLRGFDASDIRALDHVLDDVQDQVWRQAHGRRRQSQALIDVDLHVRDV